MYITSDGVLVCMHDLTYDRTTTGHGTVASQPSSVLSTIGILQPQLGPRWVRTPLPVVPRLADVLLSFQGRHRHLPGSPRTTPPTSR